MSIKEHGLERYRTMIAQNIGQAFYLGALIKQQLQMELLATSTMNIVCFRYNPGGLDDEQLNSINKEILMRMHEQNVAAPSSTVLNGRYAVRAAITNHRIRKRHLDEMLAGLVRIGDDLCKTLTHTITA